MKRDTECQLSILKEMEENKEFFYVVGGPVIGWKAEDEKRWYHLQLLVDEGLVTEESSYGYRLTAMGHDALDLHRKGLIQRAIDELGNIGLAVLVETAKDFFHRKID